MANAIYPEYKEFLLTNGATSVSLDVNTATDGAYVALINTASYTYSSVHDYVNDLGASSVGTAQRIATPTVSNGTFDGDNVTYTAVTGADCEALVIFRQNINSANSASVKLVAYFDSNVTGLPVTPNGGDITVTWSSSGIFTL